MTETRAASIGSDRAISLFLKIGTAVLVIGLVAFGVFYYKDQHLPAAPSLLSQSISQAEAAVRKTPNNVNARMQLGAAYQAAGRYADSMAQFDQVLKVSPGNKAALLGKGYAQLTSGDLAGATKTYSVITAADRSGEFAPEDTQLASAYYYLGVIDVKQHQPQVALDQLAGALKIDATDSDALYQVVLAQLQLGRTAEAVKSFHQALTFVPTDWCDPYQQLQKAYVTLGQKDEAAYAGAMVTFCQKNPTEAATELKTLTDGPAAADAMNGLGLIAQTQNDNKGAIAWFQKVVAKDPKNATALNALASFGVKPATTPTTNPTKKS